MTSRPDIDAAADIVCRCGRAYFVAGFPQRSRCPCGREIIAVSEGKVWCLSRLGARAVDSLAELRYPPLDTDSAAGSLVADYIAPRDLEPGELREAMAIADLLRPSVEHKARDEIEAVANKYRRY